MTNAIVKHDPNDTPINALWIELKDKPADDNFVYNELNDHIKYSGSNSPVIGMHEMIEDVVNNERIARRRKSSAFATPLLIIGALIWLYVAVMFGVTRFEWTGAYFIFALKTLGIGAIGTWVFFSGAGRMSG